ncbi:hypothetical protein [Variovorax atrisoli]|uniref:hypothetical protein n=1 Tax=Variovorax atrisoli TaxID=3394203 RepID=UPI001AC00B5C|nr:hypothetical protein [Variovorax paradoxus]
MTDLSNEVFSFQQRLRSDSLDLVEVESHEDLFCRFDVLRPGVGRLTYVRLANDEKTVRAFLSCTMNGGINGIPCIAVEYAVPERIRNQGLAIGILRDAISDQIVRAGRAGRAALYIEATVDSANEPAQRVAQAVLNVERESMLDETSGRLSYRYTAFFETGSRR